MADARCRRLVDPGRVRLTVGDSAALPYPDASFEKAYAMHTLYFWPAPDRDLGELRRILVAGGRVLLGYRPKSDLGARDFPSSVYAFYEPAHVHALLEGAGFSGIASVASAGGDLVLTTARRPR
jgi:ubiquinone/menaquinone biosynthesis C-methylase UbiE